MPPAYTRSNATLALSRILFSSFLFLPRAAEINPVSERCWAPTITFSKTVKSPNKPTPCNVRAIPRSTSSCGFGKSLFFPFNSNSPESGVTNPHSALNKVVLPAPLGPINPTTSFFAISKYTSLRARRPPKETLTLSTRSAALLVDMRCVDSRHTRANSCNYLVIN